jgi:predicted transcriptional regulator
MIAVGQNIEVTRFCGMPTKTFAVALGCDVRHAKRIVYSQGIRIDPSLEMPIGIGCKLCRAAVLSTARASAGGPLVQYR